MTRRGNTNQPGLFGEAPRRPSPLPNMILNTDLISQAERCFYRVLTRSVLGSGHLVFPQVSLWQLIHLPGTCASSRLRSQWENRIARRAVDFVICDAITFRPLLVIELDDASHTLPARRIKDDELAQVLAKASLPLVRVPVTPYYRSRDLRTRLAPHLPHLADAA